MGVESRFVKGGPGGPGRTLGSRNKLSEAFLTALHETFVELNAQEKSAGIEALRKTRDEDPVSYCRIIAGIMPRELTAEGGAALFDGITVNFVRPKDAQS